MVGRSLEHLMFSSCRVSCPPSIHPGHVKITGYGEVGSSITGTFEGNFTFTDSRCQPPCVKYGSIKGMFTVLRFQ